MKKGIMSHSLEGYAEPSDEQQQIERLKAENRQLKMQTTRQTRKVATEGLFDFFKKKAPPPEAAPVSVTFEKSMEEKLRDDHKLLRNVPAFTDVGTKKMTGNRKLYFSFFDSPKAVKTHFQDLHHIIDFVQTLCENTVKAYAVMHAGAEHYAETEDRAALLKAHKTCLKMTALPAISGFQKERETVDTKDLFQGLTFTSTEVLTKNKDWSVWLTGIVNKPVKDAELEKVVDYDFPMLSYCTQVSFYSPKETSSDNSMQCSKKDLVEIHALLDKAFTRIEDLLAKYDHNHNPIEDYVDEFTGKLLRAGQARNKNFNANGYYRADDNYYKGRYHHAFWDLTDILSLHVEHFNWWVHLYEPEPEDNRSLEADSKKMKAHITRV